MIKKIYFCIACFILIIPILVFGKIEEEIDTEPLILKESFHRVEAMYQLARIYPIKKNSQALLQNFLFSGDFSLTPRLSLLARLPLVMLSHQIAISNPFLGLQGELFQGLIKEFPTFITFKSGVKLPLQSDHEFVFDRTDAILSLTTLREMFHLSLMTDLSYIIKIDSNTREKSYGNEWSMLIGSEMDTGYDFSAGIHINYRRAGDFKEGTQKTISARSMFILKPLFSYHLDRETTFTGSLALPLSRQGLKEVLTVFGDYTIPGISGNTFYFLLERKI